MFEDWEADVGRTYVIGNDPKKIKLMNDVELAWKEGLNFYKDNRQTITGAAFTIIQKNLLRSTAGTMATYIADIL